MDVTDNLAQTINLQQLASNPNNSSWVFASAGSGKTKVLTDRVLRLLLSGVTPDKILCLTFTKVAATEMQNRINEKLAEWVLCDENELQKKLFDLSGKTPNPSELNKARTLFAEILDAEYNIKIQTIHSFCQGLVKIFPFEAGIKPNFEIMADASEELLLEKARRQVLKNCASNQELRALVTSINSMLHEATFAELISEILAKKEQLIILKENLFGIDGVIEAIFTKFNAEKNHDENAIFAEFTGQIDLKKSAEIADLLASGSSSKNLESAEKIARFLDQPSLQNFEFYQSAFLTDKNEPRKFYSNIAEDPDFTAFVAHELKIINAFSEELNSFKICRSTALLLKFVDAILENYAALKKQNSLLDYNDLIVETNRLLANPNFADWVKMKMDGLFDHILIDESQDTNHQQWDIIKALTEDFFSGSSAANKSRTIFVVGDEKQSIYSFQGAEPDISADIFSYFTEKLKDHPIKFHKIDLSNSFRSLPIILDAVDAVFSQEKEKSAISKISDFQGHKAIRQGLGQVEIWPQIKDKKAEKSTTKEKDYEWKFDFTAQQNYSTQHFLAQNIARKISNLVENNHALPNRDKPLNYGDFMILLRKRSDGFDKILGRFFHQYKIPFGSSGKIKFSENILIADLLAAAKFAVSTHDDLNLAALLKSPIFAISEEDLLEICLKRNQLKSTIFAALEHLPKFSALQKQLKNLQISAQKYDVFEFFHFLLNQENRRKVAARMGLESLEIIDKFILEVLQFRENFSPNLPKFLEFVEKIDPEISLSKEKPNQVTITTIHSAKGLQAPLVILPDCCFETNKLRSTKEKISWIDGLPFWCASKNDENKIIKIAREFKKNQAKEENLRLLYVALTRAEDALWIAGSGNSNDEECWYNLIRKSVVEKFEKKEFLDEKARELAGEKFEIVDEVLNAGEDFKKLENVAELRTDLRLDGVCNPVHTFIKTKNELNVETGLQTPSRIEFRTESILENEIPNPINHAQIKGKLIHKILEIFGKNHTASKKWLAEIAQKIIAKETFLSAEEKKLISAEVLNFLGSEHFENLFCGTINCEVEIADNAKFKRIDLLVEKENEVLIIDYKSEETLPTAVPQHYIAQLETYKNLVQKIYPQKKISSAIFWVKFLKLELI